jgi:integrase
MDRAMMKRRDRGTGCIRERKDGRWEGRLSQEFGPPILVYGKSKTDVKNKLFALQRDHEPGNDPERLTVGQWLERWLQSVKDDSKLSLSTYKLYKNTVDKHILPHVGAVKLTRLSKSNVWDMLDSLAKDGVGDRTRQLAHKALHRALQIAMRRDKITRNPCALVDRPSAVTKPRFFLKTPEEVLRFQAATVGSRHFALYMTALYTGMRQGEMLALTWDRVNLDEGYLDVRSTLTKDEDGDLVATKPKSKASIRRIILPKVALVALQAHHQRMQSKWVFPNDRGGPLPKDGYLRFEFRRIASKAGFPALTFHGLRHTHATLLNAKGVNAKAIQERLGWSTTRMLFDVYAHSTQTIQDEAVAVLDSVSGQTQTTEKAKTRTASSSHTC